MTVTLKHVITGKVADYPDHFLDNPIWAGVLVPTDEDANCLDCEIPAPLPEVEPEPTPIGVEFDDRTIEVAPAKRAKSDRMS